jgi:TATA-binding protein-associated factor Taf7
MADVSKGENKQHTEIVKAEMEALQKGLSTAQKGNKNSGNPQYINPKLKAERNPASMVNDPIVQKMAIDP